MAGNITAATNGNGYVDRFIDSSGNVIYIEPQTYHTAIEEANTATSKANAAAASANTTTESAKASEQARVKAEKARSDADAQRETRQLKNDADQAQNNAAAKGLTYSVCGASEYAIDPVDGKHNIPTVGGKTGVMYLTPKVSGATEEDAYDQWMYIDSKWELMGESGAHIDPTTTDDIDRIMLDSQVTADRYLNATGLTYFWAKAKEKFSAIFAQKSHSHSASDITSGVLPVLHGGTGSTDAESARAALGAASSADLATLRDSVSRKVLYHSGGWFIAVKSGMVHIAAKGIVTDSGSWSSTDCPYTIPEQYRPTEEVYAAATTRDGASCTGAMNVQSTGKVSMRNMGSAGSVGGRFASLVYPY